MQSTTPLSFALCPTPQCHQNAQSMQLKAKENARVQYCPEITILNSLFGHGQGLEVSRHETCTHENYILPTIHLWPASRRPAWAQLTTKRLEKYEDKCPIIIISRSVPTSPGVLL